jgi:two-component system CheB/CheR fusion protein
VETKNGDWFLLRIMPYRTVENVIDGGVLTFTNIGAVKKLEASLRTSEGRLQQLFEDMPVMVVAFDEQQRTVAWNQECERVTGYQAKDMIGKPDAFQLLSREGIKTDGSLLGKPRVQVRSVTCKDGSIRYVAWLSTELPLSGWSKCWIGLDVTEQREATERISGLFDSSADALAFTSLEGRFLEVNRAFLALTGHTREEILKTTYQALTPAEYRASNAQVAEELVKTGRSAILEKEYIKKDGSRIGVSLRLFLVRGSDGKPLGIGSIVRPAAKAEQRKE